MTNINPNDDILKINQNIKKGSKQNKQKEVVAQTKQVEASSLNALSSYGKANVTFKGQVSVQERKKTLENFKERLSAQKDDNGNCVFGDDFVLDEMMEYIDIDNVFFVEKLCFGKDEQGNDLFPKKSIIPDILFELRLAKVDFTENEWGLQKSDDMLKAKLVEKLCFGKDEQGNDLFSDKTLVSKILFNFKDAPVELLEKLCFGKDEEGVPLFEDKTLIPSISLKANLYTSSVIDRLCFERKENGQKVFPDEKVVAEILNWTYRFNAPIVEKLCFSKDTFGNPIVKDSEEIKRILISVKGEDECINKVLDLIELCKKNEFRACLVPSALEGHISVKDYNDILKVLGKEKVSSLSAEDLILAVRNKDLYKKENINGLSSIERKKILQNLISQNANLFVISDELKKEFPLIPCDSKEYCSLVSELASSLQINTEKISKKELKKFDDFLNVLADSVVKMSDEDFERLLIKTTGANKIQSNNKTIEKTINDMLEICPNALPEDCEKLKNALKIIKNMSSNYIYNQLNSSDKKVMLFTALLKGCDETPKQSAFNAFYILQKFDFSSDDRDKAYLLIRNQDWSKKINEAENSNEVIKSIAFDLHYSNLFEMQKLLAESDLSSKYNLFKNEKEVGYLVEELKNSQPLLPVTKFPSVDRIKDVITVVNDDYSTNLKGIYQDEKGMVIIKFNEVENETWEKIGFPKGSISKGIETIGFQKKGKETTEVKCSTGNIKFFVHALDKEENLGNFVVFGMPDSEALLSVSYAERPESKYRFFRPQGVILSSPARCVYGGGYSSSGSGSAKSIEKFKKLYAYEDGHRHQDRTFVSELIKKEMGFEDDEYVNFVEKNMNKPISEIEPKEMQIKLIKTLAKINSRVSSLKDRNYNEMFISNPEIMGVFAYSWDESEIGDVKTFINKQKDFLKDYSVENNVPFVIFGD